MKHSVQVEQSDTKLYNDQNKKSPTFEHIYNEIGEFGLYQILVVLSTGFVFFFGSFVTLNFIFGIGVPDHRCVRPLPLSISYYDSSISSLILEFDMD